MPASSQKWADFRRRRRQTVACPLDKNREWSGVNDQLNKGKRRFYFAVPQLLPKTLVKGENDVLNYNASLQDLHIYTVTLFLVKLVLSKLCRMLP